MSSEPSLLQQVKRLNQIGILLSAERNTDRLVEIVLNSAKELTGADGGTLYLVDTDNQCLRFALIQNTTLGILVGGTGTPIPDRFKPIPLRLADGSPNNRMIVAHAVLTGETINLADAYNEPGFDFSGTRHFDQLNGYRSRSFLTVPMRNHEGLIIAAIQLINKQDESGAVHEFSGDDQALAESLASQAAVALTNAQLISDMNRLFDRFTKVIASAIDAKSPQTGAHCRRVPELTLMIARAADKSGFPGLKDFSMTEADYHELSTAAWLHDCGKIVTPHHIVEKSTKLELIQDGIDAIADRFEILSRDMILSGIDYKLKTGSMITADDLELSPSQTADLRDELSCLVRSNQGGELLSDEDLAKIREIASRQFFTLSGTSKPLLSNEELDYLSIRRGTLSAAERQIMQDHMVHTINMLEQLPFPRHLKNVPEFAGGHHEKMDGTGYPKGLTREQMSVQARMMGVADVFEALTAPERSYKQAMPISQALSIMHRMVENNHLDPDLFAMFIAKGVYQTYADEFLDPAQIDTPSPPVLAWVNQHLSKWGQEDP